MSKVGAPRLARAVKESEEAGPVPNTVRPLTGAGTVKHTGREPTAEGVN
jgi:hypothetical protein